MARKSPKYIAFTLYSGVAPLDLIGPLSVLRDLRLRSPYHTVVVGERTEPIATESPLRMIPAKSYHEVPHPFAVVVPGGSRAVEAMQDASLLAYVRSAAETAELVGSTGSGALILAAAGLLSGRRAATHWAYAGLLEQEGATYARERWVDDGRFLTSAGGSAGIDMMLHLVDRLKGRAAATVTQIAVEYDPHPPFGGIDWSQADRRLADRIIGPREMASNATGEQP